jgi:hypothetical protein
MSSDQIVARRVQRAGEQPVTEIVLRPHGDDDGLRAGVSRRNLDREPIDVRGERQCPSADIPEIRAAIPSDDYPGFDEPVGSPRADAGELAASAPGWVGRPGTAGV